MSKLSTRIFDNILINAKVLEFSLTELIFTINFTWQNSPSCRNVAGITNTISTVNTCNLLVNKYPF